MLRCVSAAGRLEAATSAPLWRPFLRTILRLGYLVAMTRHTLPTDGARKQVTLASTAALGYRLWWGKPFFALRRRTAIRR